MKNPYRGPTLLTYTSTLSSKQSTQFMNDRRKAYGY